MKVITSCAGIYSFLFWQFKISINQNYNRMVKKINHDFFLNKPPFLINQNNSFIFLFFLLGWYSNNLETSSHK